jgi:proteasome lid subunit RPN8/RPN11
MKPTDEQIAAMFKHAEEVQPLECCGVIADGEYVRLANQATEHDTFAMDMRGFRDVAKAHKIEAVVHSHVYLPPLASDADLSACEATNLPWVIISWPLGTWGVIEPHGYRAPLVGRQWAWGVHDCFALIRDGFEAYAGIRIPDFERDWMFWRRGENLIVEHYKDAGFVQMPPDTPPQHCDVMGMRVGAPIINHLGLYLVDPASGTGGVLLHQLMHRLSIREVYGGTYLRATELHLRHENFLERAPPA